MRNEMAIEFDSLSKNESFARVAVAAFVAHLNPTVEELEDIKTAVSEAVTNAIIHGYNNEVHKVIVTCAIEDYDIEIVVSDRGQGIADIEKAREPLFTTRPDLERSGMGFAFMEVFMDEVTVESVVGQGTNVRMKKTIMKPLGEGANE